MHRLLGAIAAAFLVVGMTAGSAFAFDPFVTVPNGPPGGASVSGCYNANTLLFGRYRFSFCLERQGTFRVRGAAHCDGSLSWGTHRGEVNVHIRRTPCRGPVAWAQANMTCWPTGRLVHNRIAALQCIYKPTVRGYRDQHFNARRT